MFEFIVLSLSIVGAVTILMAAFIFGWSLYDKAKKLWAARQIQKVDEVYPTWRNVVMSRRFEQWLEKQPPAMRAKAASFRASDAIDMLAAYYTENC